MERSNYALISALYASKTRGLYSDIYFPIIKYVIVKIYAEEQASDKYSEAETVHDKIKELFDIKIPHVVIAKTVSKLANVKNGSIDLEAFEDGRIFKINSAFFDEDESTYEEKERSFNLHLHEIEAEYKEFIKREGTCDEDATFMEFISNNTENILGYFEKETEEQVEEKYTSMVFFLDYLHKNNEELYKVANQLFWSSVIVAFLQSDRPQVYDQERGCEAEYFVDTSIAMGLLDLSTPENEASAKDVGDIIKSSGGLLKIHPATLEEIKTILASVAQNGAYPGTSIANACSRRKLEAHDITKIQLNLQKAVESKGMVVFPSATSDIRREIINKYKGKDVLRKLADNRNNLSGESAYSSSNVDMFREAHDIFMDDYICDRRKKSGKKNIFFLTTNTDLIVYCKERHPDTNVMISTSKVILDLWMHNAKPAQVSSSVLTETMARCLDMYRSKVRHKLHEVARLFNKTKEDVAPEVYQEFLRLLYRRARNVVNAVNEIPTDDPKAFMATLQEAIKEDNSYFETVNSEISSKNSSLEKEVNQKEERVQILSEESEQKSQKIGSLKDKNEELAGQKSKLESDLEIAETALNAAKEEAEKLNKEKSVAEKLNGLYAEKEKLEEKLVQLKGTIEPLELNRSKSFSYNWPKWILGIGVAIIAVTVILLVLDKAQVFAFMSWEASAVVIAIGGIMIASALALNTEDRVKKLRENAFATWDKEHPSYPKLIEQINEAEEELKLTKREIKNSTAQK